jgi:hypothetical protein
MDVVIVNVRSSCETIKRTTERRTPDEAEPNAVLNSGRCRDKLMLI